MYSQNSYIIGMEKLKEKKKHRNFRFYPSFMERCEEWRVRTGCKTMTEFVEKALNSQIEFCIRSAIKNEAEAG